MSDPHDRYEADADAFYRDTRIMAPGKDDPFGYHSPEERWSAWEEWLRERRKPVG